MIVIGHPHPSWLGYQISPQTIFYHWNDYQETFIRSMEAIYEASLFVMTIAMQEGVDFMSDSSYGLEMTSPGTEAMGFSFPNTEHSISLPGIFSSKIILVSKSKAFKIPFLNSSASWILLTPTDDPIFAGFTKNGRPNSLITS